MNKVIKDMKETKGLIVIGGFRVGVTQEGLSSDSGLLRSFTVDTIEEALKDESILERLKNFEFVTPSAYRFMKKNYPELNSSLHDFLLKANKDVSFLKSPQFETTLDVNLRFEESKHEVSMYTFNISITQWG